MSLYLSLEILTWLIPWLCANQVAHSKLFPSRRAALRLAVDPVSELPSAIRSSEFVSTPSTPDGSGQSRGEVVKKALLNSFGEALMTTASVLIRKTKRTIGSGFTVWFIYVLALQLVLFPALADGRAASQEQGKQPLGSLSSVGQVYVSNSVAPAESTIFTGDTLRTDEMATATFTISGKGSFEIASRSQLVFAGSQQYVAELKSGIVVMSSLSGPSGINLRIGNFVAVAVNQEEQSTSKIEGAADGSFLISCSEGSVGIVPLEGPPNGTFLQAGQSVRISPQGEFSAAPAVASTTTTTSPTQPFPSAKKNSHTGWIILGVVAAGAVGGGAALAGHGSSSQTVSPSAP